MGAPYIFEFIWPNKPCNYEYFLVFFVANQYLVIEYTWPYSTIGGWFLNISLSARPTAKILAVRGLKKAPLENRFLFVPYVCT